MSTTRRPLGTGPTTSTRTTTTSPRLLPIERAEVVEQEDQEQAVQMLRGGRRILGGGPGTGT